jgi:hypothetical protein
MQHKRAAEAEDEERVAKQMRTTASTSAMAHANAVAATQAMFGGAQQGSDLFFMGSQPMLQQSMQIPMGSSVPTTQAQHMQMQMQQRQQQQQYAAAMAGTAAIFLWLAPVERLFDFCVLLLIARRNAQQESMAAILHPNTSTAMGQMNSPQLQGNPGSNVHVASLVGSQGMNFQTNTSSAVTAQPQLTSASTMQSLLQPQQQPTRVASNSTAGPPVAPQGVPATCNNAEEPCLVCGKKGDIFSCNGGCGLHVHPACIGEEAIFPFVGMFGANAFSVVVSWFMTVFCKCTVGQLCGSCFIVQQNRASTEDLTKGGTNALSVRTYITCLITKQ